MRGALPRRLGEARPDVRTGSPETAVGADRQLGPQRRRRLDLELGAIAGLGRVDPVAHRVERTAVLGSREQRAAEEREALQAVPAEVVLPALEHGDVHLAAERRRGDRHVLRQQLLL